MLPVLFEGGVRAVIELASFSAFTPAHLAFLDQLTESIGLVLHTIEANSLTEDLLEQAQSLAGELRAQQEELRASNGDLERQASLLAIQNVEAEQKNQEVEESKRLLEEKAGQLVLSSKYKSEFIANMSHELRTPLNSLLILAEQLEDNPDKNMTETQVKYASIIRASGNDLLSLLNGILESAKVESGTVALTMTDVSLGDLCGTLLSEFDQVARGKGLDFSVELNPATDNIVTDLQRLRQILKNLLSNAFKFTERGGVNVHVGTAVDGWSANSVTLAHAPCVLALSISDTGIGVAAEQQERIFEEFAQGDGSTARLYGGTGLGLSISRQLVGLLGGEITLASTPEHGSTFTVYLPGTAPRVPTASPRAGTTRSLPSIQLVGSSVPEVRLAGSVIVDPPSDSSDPAALDGTSVLVVDDDFRNLFALTALLERNHATVTIAESGAEALAVLERAPQIDIVLMDIMMPGMDGYETIRAIRALEHLRALPIIAVTGKVVSGERERCLAAGANDYVPKPVDTADLFAALGPWLQHATRAGR